MTKATIMEVVREIANKHGFEFEQYGGNNTIRDGWEWSKSWVNFTIWENPEWDLTEGTITVGIEVKASTSKMGGNQSVEDLRKAAETIGRAADLVEELNSMKLAYTVKIKEEVA